MNLNVQVQANAKKMPIENPTVEWDSHFVNIASLEIIEQDFDSEEQNKYGKDLSFNPWHGITEHRPLGGIARARKEVYLSLYQFRQNRSEEPEIKEPTNWDIPK